MALPDNYDHVKTKVKEMENVTMRPMFDYQCFLIHGKFFVGFYSKNNFQIIIRLSKDLQERAIKNAAVKPFSHGAKMGWVEMDSRHATTEIIMEYVLLGFDHAKQLAKNT